MQAREGKVDVGFDTGRTCHAKPGGVLGDVVQQGGFADTRFPAQHNDLAPPRACGLEESVQRLALVVSAAQGLFRTARHVHRR